MAAALSLPQLMNPTFLPLKKIWHLQHAARRTAMHFAPEVDYRRSDFMDGTAFRDAEPVLICESGSSINDDMSTSFGLFVVSPDFVNALRSVNATGWELLPAHVFVNKKLRELYGYTLFKPVGACGAVRWDQARKEVRPRRVRGAPPYDVRICLNLDSATRDGSDVFWRHGTAITCVTEKVMIALSRSGLSNIVLTPACEYKSFVR